MAQIQQSKLALRISGDSLVPQEMSDMICASPTFSHAKGDEIRSKKKVLLRIAPSGM